MENVTFGKIGLCEGEIVSLDETGGSSNVCGGIKVVMKEENDGEVEWSGDVLMLNSSFP
jgi:hypothetical protein